MRVSVLAEGGPVSATSPVTEEAAPESGLPTSASLPLSAGLPLSDEMGAIATFRPSPVPSLSYSSLSEYERCAYRFYVERVLGLPATEESPVPPGDLAGGGTHRPAGGAAGTGSGGGAVRGTAVHALLERVRFEMPQIVDVPELEALSTDDARTVRSMVEAFGRSATCRRLAEALDVRREQRFALALDPALPLLTGTFDVIARDGRDHVLVVDYKSDRLDGVPPEQVITERYAMQREIYALAALRLGTERVEVLHVFLEAPDAPCGREYTRAEIADLERGLRAQAQPIVERRFPVTEEPSINRCGGCPAAGGLCSWPVAVTRRPAVDRLF